MTAQQTPPVARVTPDAPPRPKRRRSVPKAEAIEAITRHHGLISAAAKSLNCARMTLYRLIDKHPDVREAVEDARDMTTDVAEASLYQAIRRGEPWAVQFYLKTQGKRRGYVERSEVDLRNVDLSQVPTDQLQAWLQDT